MSDEQAALAVRNDVKLMRTMASKLNNGKGGKFFHIPLISDERLAKYMEEKGVIDVPLSVSKDKEKREKTFENLVDTVSDVKKKVVTAVSSAPDVENFEKRIEYFNSVEYKRMEHGVLQALFGIRVLIEKVKKNHGEDSDYGLPRNVASGSLDKSISDILQILKPIIALTNLPDREPSEDMLLFNKILKSLGEVRKEISRSIKSKFGKVVSLKAKPGDVKKGQKVILGHQAAVDQYVRESKPSVVDATATVDLKRRKSQLNEFVSEHDGEINVTISENPSRIYSEELVHISTGQLEHMVLDLCAWRGF